MRRILWVYIVVGAVAGFVLLAGAILHSSRIAAVSGCDAVCEVTNLGWRVIDPGPPLWFRSADGKPRIEVAIAEIGRPTGDPINWAKTRLAGRKGAFGPLGVCKGNMPNGSQKIAALTCDAPPAPEGPRKGFLFVVVTTVGLQVIGVVAPASVNPNDINYNPLLSLASESRDADARGRAARSAIAMLTGGSYYIGTDAGASGPAIEAVYHFWNRVLTTYAGVVDQGADFVLFKSGEVWRNPGAGPRDIDPVKFKEARWRDCGAWRRQAGGIVITLNGLAPTLMPAKSFNRYEPAPKAGQRVEGQWRRNEFSTSGTTNVNKNRLIRLHADGRFELCIDSSANSGGHGFVSPTRRYNGDYRIDGYTIHLNYDDGRKVSSLFYWAGGDSDKDRRYYDQFLIDGSYWLGGLAH